MLDTLPRAERPLVTEPVGAAFRLDDVRVRELLVGENLYGDQGLALRELYQNAIDACRVLDARLTYLGQPPVQGTRVHFTQGTDDLGRPFIQCSDSGVGMSIDVIREQFCVAGAR
jgi:HSP90 family molecular chaperone